MGTQNIVEEDRIHSVGKLFYKEINKKVYIFEYEFKGSKEVAAVSFNFLKSTPKGKAKSGIEFRGAL